MPVGELQRAIDFTTAADAAPWAEMNLDPQGVKIFDDILPEGEFSLPKFDRETSGEDITLRIVSKSLYVDFIRGQLVNQRQITWDLTKDRKAQLEKHFTFIDGDVWSFLTEFPTVEHVLLEALKIVKQYFQDESLTISIARDPEEPSATQLAVLIEVEGDVQAARKQLDLFAEAWWLDNCHRTDGRLAFSLNY